MNHCAWRSLATSSVMLTGLLFAAVPRGFAQDGSELEPSPLDPGTETAEPPAPATPPAEPAAETSDIAPAVEERDRFAKNSIYLEGLGAGLLYSLNYERVFEDAIGVRVGFSYLSLSASAGDAEASASMLFFPITASYIGIRGLELGGGATLMYASASAATIGAEASGSGISPLANVLVGYRSHPDLGGGFMFRVGAMAFFGPGLGFSVEDPGAFGVLPYLYLSLGASF
jgi:hypothetical protein